MTTLITEIDKNRLFNKAPNIIQVALRRARLLPGSVTV